MACGTDDGILYRYNSPLHCAADEGHVEMVDYLARSGADLECHGGDKRTPIFYAAKSGHADVIRMLCKHGVDPNSREHVVAYGCLNDDTVLHAAARNRQVEAVIALLDCGAEPRIVSSNARWNVLEQAEHALQKALEDFREYSDDNRAKEHVAKHRRIVQAIKKKMKL